jgi:hypothetical protein
MKLYIYILLLVLLIIYINRQSNYLENFTDDDFKAHRYDAPDQYKVLKTDKVKPIQIDANSNQIPGFNSDELAIYSDKYWFVKNVGFSDIYNYEDAGGEVIYKVANGLDFDDKLQLQKPKLEETNQETKIVNRETKEKVPIELKYKNDNYNLLGTAINSYYNQYFYIFENQVKQKVDNLLLEEELRFMKDETIYQYVLAKIHNNAPVIIHWIGPRNKINLGDVTYLALATFQLGPLSIGRIYQ